KDGKNYLFGIRLLDSKGGPDGSFPVELEREWRDYIDAFAAFYELTNEQIEKVRDILEERKNDTLTGFSKSETVTKISRFPPDLKVDMTMKQRLEEHRRLLDHVRAVESKFPTDDKDVHTEWRNAKADLAKWRAELQKRINVETGRLKKIDEAERTALKKSIDT